MDIAALTRRYGVPGEVSFALENGVVRLDVVNRCASASVSLQGAQLLEWTPAGQRAVIWRSPVAKLTPGKAFRGGVPVCWPWFGAHQREAGFPAHGFARISLWEVADIARAADGGTLVTLRLPRERMPAAQWPSPCELELRLAIGGVLEIELRTRNTSGSAFTLSEALHAYFEVGDVRRVGVHGLEGCTYLDKTDRSAARVQEGALTVACEVDRVYLDSEAACTIADPVFGRRIRVAKEGSRSAVVWNPWLEKAARLGDLGAEGYLHMLCVESANAGPNAVVVAPGAEHCLRARYSVEPTPR